MSDTTSIIRQLKIDLITDQPNGIITWFNKTIGEKLQTTHCNVFQTNGREIVYHTDKDAILYFDPKNNICKINFHQWTNLRSKYDITYPKFIIIMHLLLEHHFNHSIPVPSRMHPRLRNKIEELLFNEE